MQTPFTLTLHPTYFMTFFSFLIQLNWYSLALWFGGQWHNIRYVSERGTDKKSKWDPDENWDL